MIGVGQKFPEFEVMAVGQGTEPDKSFCKVSKKDLDGKWNVLFFWPMDFTFICPTEIQTFASLYPKFQECGAELYGCSTDSEFVHLAWKKDSPLLKEVNFKLLADKKRELCSGLGILDENLGVALRATYIVDPSGKIRHVSVNDLSAGRNPEETLRILQAFQTDKMTPCAWTPGQKTIN